MRTDVKIINLKWILRKIIIPTLNKRSQVVRNREVAGRVEVVATDQSLDFISLRVYLLRPLFSEL